MKAPVLCLESLSQFGLLQTKNPLSPLIVYLGYGLKLLYMPSNKERTIAITGSASGIGASLRRSLESDGANVIGIDLNDADVIADLSNVDGRESSHIRNA